ncbi:MAG TPA: bifunctional diguanylate cyclase/phosphodiesterase [Acidimicrobiales bacterium]|nr:bifunctional diguanylate cyclase/phosphodiesterase [Acidimicrobiales bacterium]
MLSAKTSGRGGTPFEQSRARTLLWLTYGVLGLILLAYLGLLIQRGLGPTSTAIDGWGVDAFEVTASFLCIARGLQPRRGRAAALILGCGLLAWAVGDIVLTVESLGGATPPTPSPADAFYLCFYPLAYVAVVLFMRGQVRRLTTPNWLDGAVAGLGAAAVCAAFAFHTILRSTHGSIAATATDLAYPIGDLLLLALVVGGTAVLTDGRRAPWLLLATGIALNVAGDTFNLFSSTAGATEVGVIFNAIAWPTSILLMSMAVWLRVHPSNLVGAEKPTGFVLPTLGAASGLAVLFVGSVHHVGRVALILAMATLTAAGLRTLLSVRTLRNLTAERHRQSVTDHLTGLGNRRHLFNILDAFFAELADPELPRRLLAFLFIDLDHFKEINDSFGHPAGDELLRQLGPRLKSCLRSSDVLVRFGGDEFAAVLLDVDAAYATVVADRLAASLNEPFVLDVVNASISASIGIAMAPTDAEDSAGLLRCSDVAMYRAKLAEVPVALYEHGLDTGTSPLLLVEELRTAVETGGLLLHYQPQLDMRSGEIVALEALIRWPHPRLGIVPPLRFIPLAEEAGLMQALTAWVLREALVQCAAWRGAGHVVTVAVNISTSNLLDTGFTDLVGSLLAEYCLPPEALVLEMTETSIISDFDRSKNVIEELRDMGLVVSIDDFGAGFTSLAYLSSLAVGELKLDRTFITGLASGERTRDPELVRATIDLGHALGLRVVGEGVEDEATLDLLSDLGCDLAQGYCISRPKLAEEICFGTRGVTEPAALLVSG